MTQIRPTNKTENTVDLIKFYGNYKLYYKCKNNETTIFIEELPTSPDVDTILNIVPPNEPATITILSDGTITKNQIFLDKQKYSEYFSKILYEEARLSNGIDFGITPMIFKLYIILNSQLQAFPKIETLQEEDIFKKQENSKTPTLQENINFKQILKKYNLTQATNNTVQNFAIIPIIAMGHISSMLIDLRGNATETKKRLHFFDTSSGHISLKDPNMIRLNKQNLQLTGCCGYWNSCFIEECSKIKNIEEIKKQFNSGEMQLKLACRVSEIIDMNRNQHNIGFIKHIHLPLQISDEISSAEYNESDFIKITIKDTDKCFLLDKNNIHKSVCIYLDGIINLMESNKELIVEPKNYLEILQQQSEEQKTNLKNQINILCTPIREQINNIEKNEQRDGLILKYFKLRLLYDNLKYKNLLISKYLSQNINNEDSEYLKTINKNIKKIKENIKNHKSYQQYLDLYNKYMKADILEEFGKLQWQQQPNQELQNKTNIEKLLERRKINYKRGVQSLQ